MAAEITVEQLSKIVGIPIKRLLDKLSQAGIELTGDKKLLTSEQRRLFLQYLKGQTAAEKKETKAGTNTAKNGEVHGRLKVGATRKKLSSSSSSSINITVLKKRIHRELKAVEMLPDEELDTQTQITDTNQNQDGGKQDQQGNNNDNNNNGSNGGNANDGAVLNLEDAAARLANAIGNGGIENSNSEVSVVDTVQIDTDGTEAAGRGNVTSDDIDDHEEDSPDIAASVAALSASERLAKTAPKTGKSGKNSNQRNANNKNRSRASADKNDYSVNIEESEELTERYGFAAKKTGKVKERNLKNNNRKGGAASAMMSGAGSNNNSGCKNTSNSSPKIKHEIVAANIVVHIPESVTVAELSQRMSLKAAELIKQMMKMGIMATVNQTVDQDTAALVASELGYQVNLVKDLSLDTGFVLEETQNVAVLPRAPVVTIMGHVDHGKTSLLDYIRRTKVAAGEVGGITQRIGAYRVITQRGTITFLDTPGHEAFTAMRARGTQCTDIVVLVVAADDGVMPQTVEAIQHAQAAKVPIIVAVNKIDKPGADPERIRTELSKYQIIPEEWGGDNIFQNVSAKRGDGVDELLESILIVAEMQQLTAPVEGAAKGVVLESHLDKGHGPVASVLVQKGTLHQGDVVLAGLYFGKIRAMFNDMHNKITQVGPSVPAEILGLTGVPSAGDDFLVLPSEKKAREVAIFRQSKHRENKLARQQASKMESILARMKEQGASESNNDGKGSQHRDDSAGVLAQEAKSLNVVLKADLQGSVEAIIDALSKICIDEVKVNVIASGVGGITSSDVNLALVSSGVVIGFNVRADANARLLADNEGVDLRYYSVIYQLLDEIKNALTGLLAPKYEDQILGLADVRELFRSSKFGTVAGCKVINGIIKRGGSIRILRSQVVIYEGEVESIRHFKDDVNEVHQGTECGLGIKGYNDLKIGDQIEMYKKVLVKR